MNTTITESQLTFARDQRAKLVPHSFDEETGHDTETLSSRRAAMSGAYENWQAVKIEYDRVLHALECAQREWIECQNIVNAHQDVFGC